MDEGGATRERQGTAHVRTAGVALAAGSARALSLLLLQEMVADSTFEFERKRNVPIKYNRELMTKTIRAMKKIQEVKKLREERFWKNRCALARRVEEHTCEGHQDEEETDPQSRGPDAQSSAMCVAV